MRFTTDYLVQRSSSRGTGEAHLYRVALLRISKHIRDKNGFSPKPRSRHRCISKDKRCPSIEVVAIIPVEVDQPLGTRCAPYVRV
jgi:hypothetical protein